MSWTLLGGGCDLVFGVDGAGPVADAMPGPDSEPSTKRWVQIAAGSNHTCAIDEHDAIYCWGENAGGQVGDGTYAPVRRPVEVSGGGAWKQVAVGANHTCALQADDSLWCWGSNTNQQLGVAGPGSPVPVPIQGDGIPTSWKAISAGSFQVCAIAADDRLWCWGADTNGQLGVGHAGPGTVLYPPTEVSGLLNFAAVAAGAFHACGITTTGGVACWGAGSSGQLGRGGDRTDQPAPVEATAVTQAAPGIVWSEIVVGGVHTCARTADNAVWCWGYDEFGQVGADQGIGAMDPTMVAEGIVTVTAGARQTCGLDGEGVLRCWGSAEKGRLTTPEHVPLREPTVIDASRRWAAVSTGDAHTCAVDRADGTMWCTGNNGGAQLGDGAGGPRPRPAPLGVQATRLTVGGGHGCLERASSGLVACWGDNVWGQLGDDTRIPHQVPTNVASGLRPSALAAGNDTSCMTDTTTGLSCWGRNKEGQLGQGNTVSLSAPRAVTMPVTTGWGDLATGDHTCAMVAGGLYCWGANQDGQVGVAGVHSSPALVPLVAPSEVAVGTTHTCAIDAAGAIHCWGSNSYGELGRAGAGGATPQVVPGVSLFRAVSAGLGFSCAISTTDEAWCWGRNNRSQLGVTGLSGVPAALPSTWSTLALGLEHACGLSHPEQHLYCWGSNSFGQTGVDGADVTVTEPSQVGTAQWKSIAAGDYFTCGVQQDNSTWCWGRDDAGQIGDGKTWRVGFGATLDPRDAP